MSKKHDGRGRKPIFRGAMAKVIAGVLKANGLKNGKVALAEIGQKLQTVSLPTLQKLASEAGVTFTAGRPAGKATVKAAKPAKKGPGRPKGSKNKAKAVPAKRGPGRPPGSKNKTVKAAVKPVATGKKRGRPLGSKNKATLANAAMADFVKANAEQPVVAPEQPKADDFVNAAPLLAEPVAVEPTPEAPVVNEVPPTPEVVGEAAAA